jgi:hypothetical protein
MGRPDSRPTRPSYPINNIDSTGSHSVSHVLCKYPSWMSCHLINETVSQFLRPRWRSLYAARKRQRDAASQLPELPQSFFGWIPALYKITEEEVLAAAGLDAFVVCRRSPQGIVGRCL